MNKVDKKKNVWLELVRFIICGIVAALTDYLVSQLIILSFENAIIDKVWVIAISTAIGFIVSVIVNYLISTFWVFQNVKDKKSTRTPKFIALFILLSIVALLLSVGAMELCNLVTISTMDFSVVDASIMGLIRDDGWNFIKDPIFWAYIISFSIKTLVGLIFNYFTRKFILYKAPKEEICK
jgi:putative flippase GtrA